YGMGDALNGLYGVVEGSVHLLSSTAGTQSVLLEIVQAGQWFGQAGRFGGGPRLVTAIAGEKTILAFLPDHAMHAIGAKAPEIWRNFTELLYGQLAGALLLATLALSLPPAKRVAARLALLAGAQKSGPVRLSVTQSQLAEMTGLSRKTVNGHVQALEQMGLLSLSYGALTVLDPARLLAQAGISLP
ncbi:MAG TPA: Crp/Fnr family transcriptional regulator, partial [Rhizomicrobium sp.]|nr:Crp/Fnr family transcriptional regulator [Rhizomicrobium sp.]